MINPLESQLYSYSFDSAHHRKYRLYVNRKLSWNLCFDFVMTNTITEENMYLRCFKNPVALRFLKHIKEMFLRYIALAVEKLILSQ